MKKIEQRTVEVNYCDFCREEAISLDRCAVCKKEMCNKAGGAIHSAFSIEIYRYYDGQRFAGFGSKVCKECENKGFGGTIGELFNEMIKKGDMPLKQIN